MQVMGSSAKLAPLAGRELFQVDAAIRVMSERSDCSIKKELFSAS
jgi:hypothetical protein